MSEAGGNRSDWGYLKGIATLKALFAGEGDKTFDELFDETFTVKGGIALDDTSRRRVMRNLRESTSAPDAPVKQSYPSPDPCSGGCVGYRTGCTYSHCWG